MALPAALPGRGLIGIFNRSHYEEVLVVRVHEELLAAERMPAAARDHGIWARRYREINDWERYLATAAVLVTVLDAIQPEVPGRRPRGKGPDGSGRGELAAELGRTGPG